MRRQSWVKVVVSIAAAACVCAGIILAQGALAGLGVSDAAGKRIVDGWLDSGYLNLWEAAKSFKAATPAGRVALTKGAIAWAKTYTESAAFKADYEKQRQAHTPKPPVFNGTVADEMARQRAERKKTIDDMKQEVAKMTPEMRKAMEADVKEAEAANQKIDSDPEMVAMARQVIEQQRSGEKEAYQGELAAHEKRFPASPRTLIARRLQTFLDVSKDVDFDAKLVSAGSKMRFADPRYEEESPLWKLCYRAGRDAVAMAREAAQAWLKTL